MLIKLNVLGGAGNWADLSLQEGLFVLIGCLPVAIVGYLSAIAQGRVAAAGIQLLGKRPRRAARAFP